MLVVYDSLTGNVKRFVGKLDMESIQLTDSLIVNEPYILVTYTVGFGQVPEGTQRFLLNNNHYIMGVASSGNRNWGSNFARAASSISKEYNVPIIHTFELAGNVDDVGIFNREVESIVVESNSKMDRVQ